METSHCPRPGGVDALVEKLSGIAGEAVRQGLFLEWTPRHSGPGTQDPEKGATAGLQSLRQKGAESQG